MDDDRYILIDEDVYNVICVWCGQSVNRCLCVDEKNSKEEDDYVKDTTF